MKEMDQKERRKEREREREREREAQREKVNNGTRGGDRTLRLRKNSTRQKKPRRITTDRNRGREENPTGAPPNNGSTLEQTQCLQDGRLYLRGRSQVGAVT